MEQDKIRSRSRLQNVMDILAAKKVDIYEKIRTAEAEGRRCTAEIQEWLLAVERLEQDKRRTIEEKNRFFTWNYFLKRRSLMKEARALKQQSEILPILVARANPDLVQEIPVPERFMMHDSLEANLNMVLDFIRGEEVGGKIGIRGMAGVGKTTLLLSINNALLKAADQSQSCIVIYVHISKEITVKKLQIKISERLNLDLPRNASTAFQANIIFNFLRKKEFVLLLDDLWESIDLQEVGIPCLESSSDGLKRKVVFTTRNEAICSNMNVDINIIVEPLNSETAWQLFERTIGKNSLGSDERVHCLAREIVSICKGLPLALIASGQIMSTKHTVEAWDDTVKAMQRGNHPLDWDDPLFEAVTASYDSLPNNNIKRCFLCCSWWPKDCSIRKNELIVCWVGLGLIDGFDDMLEAYLMGYHIIRSLLEASLLEAGDDVDGEVRMHALIRGVALRIAPKTLTEIVPESIVPAGTKEGRKVRWKGAESAEEISLMNEEDIQSLAKDQFISPELKTLILRNNPLEEIPGGLLRNMTALTYLDLSYTGIKTLPKELGMLTGLQYLNLSHTPILSMTQAIGNLVRLRYLHLSYTPYLKHIPLDDMAMLVDLRLLDMFRSGFTDWDSLFNLLDVVGGSKSKRRFGSNLMDLGITVESISVLVQVSTLPAYSLASRLSITKVKEVTRLHVSPIRLRNLEELCIEDCIELEELVMVNKHIEDEKYLCLSGPTALQLHRLARLKKIIWKGAVLPEFLQGLHSLEIDGCSMLENITWASKIPFLDKLTLSNCKRMKQVIETETAEDESIRKTMKEEYMGALSSIKYLLLRNLPKLYAICNRKEEFPYLRSATIDNCPNLKLSPGLQNLVNQKKVTVIRVDGPDMTGNLSRFLPVLRSGSHSNNLESAICIDNLVKHLELEENLPSSSGFYGVSDDVRGTLLQKKICEFVLVDAHFPSSLRKTLYNAFVRADLQLPIFNPGTNVLTAIVYGRTLFVASAGKSRAVLGRRGKAIELVEETLRKEDNEPPFNLTEQTLTEEDEFLIMATNGLWDVMSSQQAVTIVREELMCHKDPKSCSEKLVQLAHTNSWNMRDDLSVVVVCFSSRFTHPPSRILHFGLPSGLWHNLEVPTVKRFNLGGGT